MNGLSAILITAAANVRTVCAGWEGSTECYLNMDGVIAFLRRDHKVTEA